VEALPQKEDEAQVVVVRVIAALCFRSLDCPVAPLPVRWNAMLHGAVSNCILSASGTVGDASAE